ncbi:MAG: xanthine dehydrogenase family protein molybdopterin-binding subunit [Woeseia sp.]
MQPIPAIVFEGDVSELGTGQAIARKEDQRFLTGKGRYTDDIVLEGQTWLRFYRSPFAHGIITELDTSEASAMPGVLAVYTGQDLLAAGVRDVTGAAMPDGSRKALKQPPLARDRVRYVGEPVVAVVAESLAIAQAAADSVLFDVDELPAVVTPGDALRTDESAIHAELDSNHYGTMTYGDLQRADAAFKNAAQRASIDVINNRVAPAALEPRACNASYDPEDGSMLVYQGCQGAHALRDRILRSVDLDKDKLRVICPDVGGGFGLKFFLQCETVVAVFASKQLGRPVKWTADRSESFQSDVHGRDHESHAEIALDDDGKILAMRATINANIGAYCSQAGPIIPWFGACMSSGCYDIPALHVAINMVVSNTVPVDAYRGAGRPEAAYLIERLMDRAALQLGFTRDEIRRRNFIAPEQFPYLTATGRSYDSGRYCEIMEAALQRAEWAGFEQRQKESRDRGQLRGIGFASYVEICSAAGSEETHIAFKEDGRLELTAGTQSTGQGHETSYAQVVAAVLGTGIDQIDLLQGDTLLVPTGQGTNGSRSLAIAGSALHVCADLVIAAGKRMAAVVFNTPADHIDFANGYFQTRDGNHSARIADIALASFDITQRPTDVLPGLRSQYRFEPDGGTFPNGCHVCEVEIDPATGVTRILRYTVEDDVGVVINPLLLEGQIVGGVAQGLGQALTEQAVYDRDGGQLLSATFMDYGMPRSDWVPEVNFRYREVPSPRNPLGVKGAGEAGTVGAAPALVNAVLDALAPCGVEHLDMPLTPQTVWRALQDAS